MLFLDTTSIFLLYISSVTELYKILNTDSFAEEAKFFLDIFLGKVSFFWMAALDNSSPGFSEKHFQ